MHVPAIPSQTLCCNAILNLSYDNMIQGLCDSKPVHQQIQNLTIFISRNPSYQWQSIEPVISVSI